MKFKTKKTIDDPSDEGESDIISQEDNRTDYIGSRVNPKTNNSVSAPEWSDPWSSDHWTNVPWGDTRNTNQKHIESSFESLQFTPVLKTAGENSDLLDVADAFGVPFGPTDTPPIAVNNENSFGLTSLPSASPATKGPKVNLGVVVNERLSIIFDETTNDPSCKVVGGIYVKPTKRRIDSFSLTIRDGRANVEQWIERNNRCRNITAGVPHLALDPGDQVFSISLNREHQNDKGLDAPVVSYTCSPLLRPMPMLLKTKSHQKSDRCRLGIRIRANPQNTYILEDIIILIIVPFGLDGGNVIMSRKGGIWDEMKRTLIWNISNLDPGEIIDIQAQFKSILEGTPSGSTLEHYKFPVLARCRGKTTFSKIDLNTDYNEDGSCPVGLDMERSATILYRKI